MSEYDKLDGFLREKLKDREYVFKDTYWQAAEELIEAEQAARKKRRRFFFFFLFGLLGMGSMIASIYHFSQEPRPIATSHFLLSEAICENYEYLSRSTSAVLISEKTVGRTITNKVSFDSTPKNSAKVNTPSILISKSVDPNASARPVAQDDYIDSKSRTASPISQPLYRGQEVDFSGSRKSLKLITQIDTEKSFSVHKIRQKGFSLFFQPDDSVLYANSAKGEPIHQRHYFGLGLGRNLALGFQNNRVRAGLSQHTFVGMHYAYALRPGTRLKTGIYYQGRGGLNADTTFRSLNYSFGLQTEATTISPQRLHYLEVPLLLETHLKGRHNLELGTNLGFLLNVSSQVNRQDIRAFNTEDLGTERQWGFTQGFNKLDWGIMAGYSYYLNKGLRVGLKARYGLNDITNNQFFNNQSIDKNLQIRLMLEYDLFHF